MPVGEIVAKRARWSLRWDGAGEVPGVVCGTLVGELTLQNSGSEVLEVAGKPQLRPMGVDGDPQPASTLMTLEYGPGPLIVLPGQVAVARVRWNAWIGARVTPYFQIRCGDLRGIAKAASDAHPVPVARENRFTTSWFRRISGPES